MEESWYYVAINRSPVGPHSREALEALRANNRIVADTLVWKQGTERWVPYSVSGLKAPLGRTVPPPVPAAVEADPNSGSAAMHQATVAAGPVPAAPHAPGAAPVDIAKAADVGLAILPSTASTAAADAVPGPPTAQPPRQAVDDDGWQATHATPWRRYFARMVDSLWTGVFAWAVLAALFSAFSPALYRLFFGADGLAINRLTTTILTLALAAPVNALLLGVTGTTLGKWVFGIRITDPAGRAIGFARAGAREVVVFLKGLGLGIPIVSLFTLLAGYQRVKNEGSAAWDAGQPWVVTYRPSGAAQTTLCVLGVIVFFAALLFLQVLGQAKG